MKKRGFTLIELLAVIVILAIIALIAVPTVINIITKARKSAFKDSAYGIIKAGELYYAENLLNPEGMISEVLFEFPNNIGSLPVQGKLPSSGQMKISLDGEIAIAISDGTYCVKKGYTDTDIKVDNDIENCMLEKKIIAKKLEEIATINKDLGIESIDTCAKNGICENGTAFAIKVNENDIYKFYVIEDTGKDVTLIMDRNMGGSTQWISYDDYTAAGGLNYDTYGNNEKGPLTALNKLESLTSNWENIASYNYILQDDKPDYLGATVRYQAISRNNVRARMLTYKEAANLGCTPEDENSCPNYLIDNLGDMNESGYWLSTAFSDSVSEGWIVYYLGTLDASTIGFFSTSGGFVPGAITIDNGVRPVIKISK